MKIRSFNTNEYMSWMLSSASPHNIVISFKICDNLNEDILIAALLEAEKKTKHVKSDNK